MPVWLCCTVSGGGEASGHRSEPDGQHRGTDPAGRYGIEPDFHRATDIHLHVGVGPGDGTSGGVTMAAALVLEMTGRVVRGDVAMTGEVTLSG